MGKHWSHQTLPVIVPAAMRKQIIKDNVLPRTAVQHSIQAFEKAVGGRQALIESLSTGEVSPEVQEVLGIIADPRYDHWTLSRICVKAGITPGQLFQAFKHAALARAQVLAILETANKIPGIVQQLLNEAIAHTIVCATCNGVGKRTKDPTPRVPNPEPQTCSTCQGLGTIHVQADLERQKIALELAQLLKKSGGIAVNTQVNVESASAHTRGGSLEQLQQAVGEILYGPTPQTVSEPALDAQIEEADPDPDPEPEEA